jgi:hypothetical protein
VNARIRLRMNGRALVFNLQSAATLGRLLPITSAARSSKLDGNIRGRAAAGLSLTASSMRVACCTGRSARFSPFRMRGRRDADGRDLARQGGDKLVRCSMES